MSERDPMPTVPDCPACDRNQDVRRNENEHQGRWLCLGCMLLFDGTSAEWLRPERPREDISDGLKQARAALEGSAGGA